MSLFSRRTRKPSDGDAPKDPQRVRSLAVEHSHRGLTSEDRKVEILDLGGACGETLAYYTGLPCRLHFADFYADLKAQRREAEDEAEAAAAVCAEVLPFPSSTRLDLIHSWDLFNYLSLVEIAALTSHLRRFSSDAAPLVSLIWTTARIPAQPNRYAIIDQETVEYRPTSDSQRPGPRLKEPDLLRAMAGYRVGHSFLLRHGIQEYIFQPRISMDVASNGEWSK